MTSVNTINPQHWGENDTTTGAGSDKNFHYFYRWWTGNNQNSEIKRYYRLWIDENNGCLYWYSGNQNKLKLWIDPNDDTPSGS